MKTPLLALIAAVSCAAGSVAIDVHISRARELLRQMDFHGALAEAEAVSRTSLDDVTGYQLMAAALLELGDYDQADKQLQWMLDLRIGKTDPQGWLLVARLREVTGDIEGALDAVNAGYARLAPGQEGERQALAAYSARLLYLSGKYDLAEQAIERAAVSPEVLPSLLETRARLRLAQGKRLEAVRILRQLTARDPDPRYLYLLAKTSGAAADYAAFEPAARSVAASPANANRELALYYSTRGRQPAKALESARLESQRRQDIYTLDALALALFVNGRNAEARATMQRVLAVGTQDPEILAHARRIGVKRP